MLVASRCPAGAACHPLSGCTRGARGSVDTFVPSVRSSIRRATGRARTPRCPRRSGRPPPGRRRWTGSAGRRTPGCPVDRPCRTAGRTDSPAIPSLWHAASSGVSEPSVELRGSRQSPGSRAPWYAGLELRPLPSTGVTRLPRYYEPVRHPARPGLSLAGVRSEVTRLRRSGLPVLQVLPLYRHAVAITPVGSSGQIAHGTAYSTRFPCSPTTAAFPVTLAGRLPRQAFRGLLSIHSRYGLSTRCTAGRYICLEGSDGFVTSTAAPIASGRSDRIGRAGLAPAGKSLPLHGAQPLFAYGLRLRSPDEQKYAFTGRG